MTINKQLSRKKIFNVVEKASQISLDELQKEEVLIRKNVDANKKIVDEKKQKISSIKNEMVSNSDDGFLDLERLNRHRDYLSLLQDELIKDELLSKSLKKQHRIKMDKLKEKYKETKLYQNIINKAQGEIVSHEQKNEEKEMEELANLKRGSQL